MGLTALQAQGGLNASELIEYRGATTAARFGDLRHEFSALRSGCGAYDLGFRAKISVTGSDRVRWLNGMITNNVRDLAVGHGVYGFLLNPQGRILGDLYAYNRGESITVDTDVSQLENILTTFDHYIIMDDVEIASLSSELTAIGVAGPKSREVLRKAGIDVPELQQLQVHSVQCDCECGCLNCTLVRGDDPVLENYEIWIAPAQVKPLWEMLLKAGALAVGVEALEMQRIASGVPLYGVDIRERDLPQETEQVRALNFSKGCYIGQEIVERIRSRGAVHRKFAGVVVEEAVAPGSKIVVAEKEVGEVTSVASIPFAGGEKTVAIGYIRREVGTPGLELAIGTSRAKVVGLPFSDAELAQDANVLAQKPA
jgi:folate-binding protein YgfZ